MFIAGLRVFGGLGLLLLGIFLAAHGANLEATLSVVAVRGLVCGVNGSNEFCVGALLLRSFSLTRARMIIAAPLIEDADWLGLTVARAQHLR